MIVLSPSWSCRLGKRWRVSRVVKKRKRKKEKETR